MNTSGPTNEQSIMHARGSILLRRALRASLWLTHIRAFAQPGLRQRPVPAGTPYQSPPFLQWGRFRTRLAALCLAD